MRNCGHLFLFSATYLFAAGLDLVPRTTLVVRTDPLGFDLSAPIARENRTHVGRTYME